MNCCADIRRPVTGSLLYSIRMGGFVFSFWVFLAINVYFLYIFWQGLGMYSQYRIDTEKLSIFTYFQNCLSGPVVINHEM